MNNDNIFKLIIDNSPLACSYNRIVLDEEGGKDYEIIQANSAFKTMIGLEGQVIEGRKLSDLKTKLKYNNELSKCFDQVTLDGKSKDYKNYYIQPQTYCKIKVHFTGENNFIVYVSECELNTSDLSNYMRTEDRIQEVFDSIQTQMWSLLDRQTYGYCNKAHADFLGLRAEEVEFKNIYYILQKDEANICVLGNDDIFTSKKTMVSEELLVNFKGEERLLKTTKTPILDENGNIEMIICMADDITEINKLEAQKLLKENILHSMIDFTDELLTNKDYDNALYKGISHLGQATKVDRVYYWENHFNKDDNKWYTSQRYEWTNDGVDPQVDNPDLQNVPFEDVSDFVDILARSEHFNYHVRDIENEFTKEFLGMQGILSILVLPVIIEGEFRGFVGFDSTKAEKDWSEIEISLLHSFVLLYKKSIERHLLEEEASKAKDNFDNLINTIPDLLLAVDIDANVSFANKSVYDRLGYTEEEIIGKPALMLHPPLLRQLASEILGDMVRGKREHCPIPIMSKYGELIEVETRITRGVWNGKDSFFTVTKDVSDLKMSEEKFYKAFNNGGVAMYITSMEEGEFLEVNDKFLEIIGLSRDQVIGKTSNEIGLFSDLNQREDILEILKTDKTISDKEFKINGRNGKILNGQLNVIPINVNKQPCLLSSLIDMTDQKQMVEDLRKAKEMSDVANNAKSEFLAHMSHEIRTPMNAVISYSDLLLSENLSLKQDAYVQGIKNSSKILMSMINDTLDWAKIENTGLELENIPFNIEDILENVISLIKFKRVENEVEFFINRDKKIPTVILGDPLRLQQVLLNLLSNASKFTLKGKIEIDLRLINYDSKKIELEISISDTGIGISQEQISTIFDPFKQANNKIVNINSGTGLGLAISKKIVQLMGGDLRVKSLVGVGSTFYFNGKFNLPDEESTRIYNKNTLDLSKERIKDPGKYENIRVLVVDDNEINQDILKEILERLAMKVRLAGSGKEAVEEVKSRAFDIILLDIRMPEMDGYETIKAIRNIPNYDQVPIIAVTASVSVEEKEKCIIAGFNEYIIKPIDKNKLIVLINKHTNKNKEFQKSRAINEREGQNEVNKFSLNDLIGIDTDECLKHFMGDHKFVASILKNFYKNHKFSIVEIKDAIQKDDFITASRLVHTLKGLAGEIKAHEIYNLAASLEKEMDENKNVDELLNNLERQVNSLCNSIDSLDLKSYDCLDLETKDIDHPDLSSLLERLEKLLIDSDMEANKIIDRLVFITKNAQINTKLKEIKNYCSQYDYDNALIVLEDVSCIVNREEE